MSLEVSRRSMKNRDESGVVVLAFCSSVLAQKVWQKEGVEIVSSALWVFGLSLSL